MISGYLRIIYKLFTYKSQKHRERERDIETHKDTQRERERERERDMCVCVCLHTEWNDKIVVLKKTTLQLLLKHLLKKSIQVTWLCSRADIYSM